MKKPFLKFYLLAGLALGFCSGCNSSTEPSKPKTPPDAQASIFPLSSPANVMMDNPRGWSSFWGGGQSPSMTRLAQGFQVTTNAGGSGTWASIAWFFDDALDASLPYQLTLRVRGIGGAKNLGLTSVLTGQNASPENSNLKQQVFALNGQDQTITFTLPQTPAGQNIGVAQIALHFGYEFHGIAAGQLGNPLGSGIIIQEAQLNQIGVPLKTPAATPAPSPVPNVVPAPSNQIRVVPTSPPVTVPVSRVPSIGSPAQAIGLREPSAYTPVADTLLKPNFDWKRFGRNVTDIHPVVISDQKPKSPSPFSIDSSDQR